MCLFWNRPSGDGGAFAFAALYDWRIFARGSPCGRSRARTFYLWYLSTRLGFAFGIQAQGSRFTIFWVMRIGASVGSLCCFWCYACWMANLVRPCGMLRLYSFSSSISLIFCDFWLCCDTNSLFPVNHCNYYIPHPIQPNKKVSLDENTWECIGYLNSTQISEIGR